MSYFRAHFLVFNGCLWLIGAGEASPKTALLPAPPYGSSAVRKPTHAPAKKPVASNQTPRKMPPRKMPLTHSKLSPKPDPRRPAKIAATGGSNPDKAGIGLADRRLLSNAAAPEFSLEDAIVLTLANNPQRQEAQAAVNAATANIGAVGAAGKLQVGANGTTEYGRNTSTSNALAMAGSSGSSGSSGSAGSGSAGSGDSGGDAGSGGSAGGDTASTASPSRSFLRFDQLTVNATLPITTGGRVRASTRQARYQAVAQIYQLAQVEQDLILSTTLAYLDVLRSTQLLRVTNANLSVSQERVRVARLRFSVGASARLDVLQAETDLSDARSRRIQAVNALGTSNSNLNVLLGRAPETPIRVVPITRLNLPNVAYNVQPTSVLSPAQTGQGSAAGNATSAANGNTGTNGTSRSGGTNSNATPGNNGPANSQGSGMGATGRGNTATNGGAAASPAASNGKRGASNSTGQASASGPGASRTGNSGSGTSGAGAVFSGPSAPGGSGSSSGGSSNGGAAGVGGGATNSTGGASSGTSTGGSSGTIFPGSTTAQAGNSGSSSGGTASAGSSAASGTASGSMTGASSGSSQGSTSELGNGSVGAGASADLQSLAGSTRQSLAVTQAQIGAAEAAVDVAKAGKKPKLGLNLTSLLRNPATFLGNFGASIGLGLAQNLFDSHRTKEQVNVAESALEQLKARLAGQRLEVAGAIETSLLTLDSAQQRQENSESGVRSASEALRVATIGFRSGVRTTLDLADAQAALLSAQTDAVNARFDVADAQAALAAAVGIYTVEAQRARERVIQEQQEAAAQARKQFEILHPVPKKKKVIKQRHIFGRG